MTQNTNGLSVHCRTDAVDGIRDFYPKHEAVKMASQPWEPSRLPCSSALTNCMPQTQNHDATKMEKGENTRAVCGYTSRDPGTIGFLCSRGRVSSETQLTWRVTAFSSTAFLTMQRARSTKNNKRPPPARPVARVTRDPIIGFPVTARGLCPKCLSRAHASREQHRRCFRRADKGMANAWQRDRLPSA